MMRFPPMKRFLPTNPAPAFRCNVLLPATLFLFGAFLPPESAAQEPPTTGAAHASVGDSVAFVLDPVTVHATRMATPLFRVPLSVTVLEGGALERRMAASLDDVLVGLANVTSVGGPRRQAELPVIRGFGANRLVVRIDGARQEFQSGHKGRLFLEPALLSRVEVIRGPSSTVHGSGGLGGVLAFETVSGRQLLRPGESLGMLVRPSFRTGASEWRGAVTLFGASASGGADGLLSLGGRRSDDVRLGDGSVLPFSGADFTDVLAKAGWEDERIGRLELSLDRFDESSTTPLQADADNREDAQLGDRTSGRETLRLGWKSDGTLGGGKGWTAVAYRNVTHVNERRLSDRRFETRRVRTLGMDVTNTTFLEMGSRTRLVLATGFEGYGDEVVGSRDGGPLGTFPDGSTSFAAVFIQPTLTLFNRLTISPALRWDRYSFSSDDPDLVGRQESEVPLKLAVGVDATRNLTAFGSVSEGFNVPRLTALYATGLHFPGRGPVPNNFFVPNPDLVPERTTNLEAGVRLRAGDLLQAGDGVLVEAVGFRSDATDFIAQEVDVFGGVTTSRNVAEVDVDGVEASIRYEASAGFAGLSYGRVRQTDRQSGDPVNSAPADTWTLDAGVRIPKLGVVVGYRAHLAHRQDRVTDPSLETPGYAVSDLFASWALSRTRWSGAEISARVSNLFDRAYRRHGLPILAPGRELRVGVTWRASR